MRERKECKRKRAKVREQIQTREEKRERKFYLLPSKTEELGIANSNFRN